MERVWLKSYPPGVSAEIDLKGFVTLLDLMDDTAHRHRDKPAFICMDRTLTYGEVEVLSHKLAGYFIGLGLKKGDRVAVMLPNLLQYPIAISAILRAGMIAVNVNPLYTPRELEHQLRDSGARAIIILENFAHTLQEVIARTNVEHVVMARVGDLLGTFKGALVNFIVRRKVKISYDLPQAVPFNKALAIGRATHVPAPNSQPEDVAVLQYTGGTTGLSKGAMLTHRALLASVMAGDQWLRVMLEQRNAQGEIIFGCALPLYHVYAFVNCSLSAMRMGGCNVLIPNPRDVPALVKELAKHRVQLFPCVNTLFNSLVNEPSFAKMDFSHFVGSTGGGAAVQEAVATKWMEITGTPIVEGYGLSETCSGITCNRGDIEAFTGTVGLPVPGVDIRIIDDSEIDVPFGQIGEIAIKGPQLMSGYWNQPEETAKTMTSDGWFKSGDLAVMNEAGYITIVDRKKDMIKVSGFNVYPNEVEAVAASHPGVLEAAVVGSPNAKTGEAVILFIVPKDPELTLETLKSYLRENLTAYKIPHRIEFREALPKTNVGKILRRQLRDEILDDKKEK